MICDVHQRSMYALHGLTVKNADRLQTTKTLQASLTAFRQRLQKLVRVAVSSAFERASQAGASNKLMSMFQWSAVLSVPCLAHILYMHEYQ